jgi:Tol biopolymer transport system component
VRELSSFGDRQIGRALWMPDGNSLVASVAEASLGRHQLEFIDYPSGETHRFTNDLADYSLTLDLSSDGQRIAAAQISRTGDIWTVPSAASAQARQITSRDTVYSLVAAGPVGKVLAVNFSGDVLLMNANGGEHSVLVPEALTLNSLGSCADRYVLFDRLRGGKLELWRVDADGSNPTSLAAQVNAFDCSPDGKWIYYSQLDKKMYRMPADGGQATAVLDVPGVSGAGRIAVSPDGRQIAFSYQEGNPVPVSKLGVLPAGGGTPSFIAQLPLGSGGLRWAPSGKALAYALTRNGAGNIWEQSLAGGDPHQLTNFTSDRILSFDWSRDGKQLLLSRGNQSSDVILISNFQ